MTREEALNHIKYSLIKGNYALPKKLGIEVLEMAIEALEIVDEFERAYIITNGRLNGRTYAYKCGLEDGRRKALKQEPCEDCISRANALRVAKNEYLRGWQDALCKALSEKYSIHCEEGNLIVIQEETITGLRLSMDCAVGKDVESYMSTIPSVTPTRKVGKWKTDGYGHIVCTVCNEANVGIWKSRFCPNCGAEMESKKQLGTVSYKVRCKQ